MKKLFLTAITLIAFSTVAVAKVNKNLPPPYTTICYQVSSTTTCDPNGSGVCITTITYRCREYQF